MVQTCRRRSLIHSSKQIEWSFYFGSFCLVTKSQENQKIANPKTVRQQDHAVFEGIKQCKAAASKTQPMIQHRATTRPSEIKGSTLKLTCLK